MGLGYHVVKREAMRGTAAGLALWIAHINLGGNGGYNGSNVGGWKWFQNVCFQQSLNLGALYVDT